MRIREFISFLRTASPQFAVVAFALAVCLPAAADDLPLPTLKTKHGTFTNVVIMSKKATEIYISHENGLANVKLDDIEDEAALVALGIKTAPPTKAAKAPAAVTSSTNTESPVMRLQTDALAKFQEVKPASLSTAALLTVLGICFVIYFFFCYCLKLICEKTGTEPGLLIWLPLLQMIPAYRAAGLSGWWVLALLVPVLNFVAQILWCFRIASARGKSIWVAIALLFPVLNLFAFIYLAFSGTEE